MDIAEFLTAQYDEEEVFARATTPVPIEGRWRVARDKHADADAPVRLVQGVDQLEDEEWASPGEYFGTPIIVFSAEWQDEAEANLRHVAHWDPAHVLADLAAKRKLLKLHIPERYLRIRDGRYVEDPPRCTVCTMPYPKRGNWQPYPCDLFRLLAAPYADHPDFDPDWAVDA